MNANNDIASLILACSNDITSRDKLYFYVTLYQPKHNQKEEASTYHIICVASSKRIKRQLEILKEESDGDTGNIGEVLSNVCEGLTRMLSALYCHTSSHVMSSTMAKKISGWKIQFFPWFSQSST